MAKKYYTVFFEQGEDAKPYLDFIDQHGESKMISLLIGQMGMADLHGKLQWQVPSDSPSFSKSDTVCQKGEFIMSYNKRSRIGYIGMEVIK